ncbi:MAG TPA: tetratricopeptide repeat protein [Chloroflexia bacterium]
MNTEIAFGEWLKKRRKDLDLTQLDLADRVGCSPFAIQKLEAGTRRPSRQIARLLAGELGVPEREQSAFIRFARGVPSGADEEERAEATLSAAPHDEPPATTQDTAPAPANITLPMTRILGRQEEIGRIDGLLAKAGVRLLTITGPGGVGKTRLATEVALGQVGQFSDGVCFVPLAPVRDSGLVAATIAEALGIKDMGDQPLLDTLRQRLHDRQMLLVLDNFEQVMPAATLVIDLLESAPRLKVLVTSRAALNLRGEQQVPLSPLPLPDLSPAHANEIPDLLGYPSIQLFVERAQSINPAFALAEENAAAVAAICARLDGLPLAIELVAARSKLLSPRALLSRLDNRLALLKGGPQDMPARHQTLRDTIAWSYDLLDEAERALFARMGAFVGGFTLAAAEAVCNAYGDLQCAVLEGIESLLDKSLIRQAATSQDEARFTMLETIREYALEQLEQLGEVEGLRLLHAEYYLALTERAEPELRGPQQVSWLDRLEQELDNLRAALRWTLDHDRAEMAARIAGGLWHFWYVRGYLSEGRKWMEEALVRGGEGLPLEVRWWVLHGAGRLAMGQSDYSQATALLNEGLETARQLGDAERTARSLYQLAGVGMYRGDYEESWALQEEALALYQATDSRWNAAASIGFMGTLALYQGDFEQANAFLRKSIAQLRELGEHWYVALELASLCHAVRRQGDLEQAEALAKESIAIFRELGDKRGMDVALLCLADVARYRDDYAQARSLYREALDLITKMGDRHFIGLNLIGLAFLSLAEGQPERTARIFGAVEALRERAGSIMVPPADQAEYDRALVAMHSHLEEPVLKAAWDQGRSLPLEQVIDDALSADGGRRTIDDRR